MDSGLGNVEIGSAPETTPVGPPDVPAPAAQKMVPNVPGIINAFGPEGALQKLANPLDQTPDSNPAKVALAAPTQQEQTDKNGTQPPEITPEEAYHQVDEILRSFTDSASPDAKDALTILDTLDDEYLSHVDIRTVMQMWSQNHSEGEDSLWTGDLKAFLDAHIGIDDEMMRANMEALRREGANGYLEIWKQRINQAQNPQDETTRNEELKKIDKVGTLLATQGMKSVARLLLKIVILAEREVQAKKDNDEAQPPDNTTQSVTTSN